jgi:hypothetical protein
MTAQTVVPLGSVDDTLCSDIGGEDVKLGDGRHCSIISVEKKQKKRRKRIGRKRSSNDEDGEDVARQRRRLVLILASFVPFVLACVTLAIVCFYGSGKRAAKSDEIATAPSFQQSYLPALARVALGPLITTTSEEPSLPQPFPAVPAAASDAEIFANWGNIPV